MDDLQPPQHLRTVRAFSNLRSNLPRRVRNSWGQRFSLASDQDLYELPHGEYTSQTYPDAFQPIAAEGLDEQTHGADSFNTHAWSPAILPGYLDRGVRQIFALDSNEAVKVRPRLQQAVWREVRFPLFCIQGSMLAVLGTIAVLVSAYRVVPDKGLWVDPTSTVPDQIADPDTD
jgi:hypothetical protein